MAEFTEREIVKYFTVKDLFQVLGGLFLIIGGWYISLIGDKIITFLGWSAIVGGVMVIVWVILTIYFRYSWGLEEKKTVYKFRGSR